MKRLFSACVAAALLALMIAPMSLAKQQVHPGDKEADLNNDGVVTETETKLYNRDVRD